MDPAHTAPVDAAGHISTDIICRRCSYNLRGLSPYGLCPECGASTRLSLQGDLLIFSNPLWVESIALGARLVSRGFLLAIASFVCLILAGPIRFELAFVVFAIAVSVGFVGIWILAQKDPADLDAIEPIRRRTLLRASVILLPLGFVIGGVALNSIRRSIPIESMVFITFTSLTLSLGGAMWLCLAHLGGLAIRIPSTDLARQTLICRRWLLLCMFLACAFGTPFAFTPIRRFQTFWFGFGILAWAAIQVAWMISATTTLSRIAKEFTDHTHFARDMRRRAQPDTPSHPDLPASPNPASRPES